jgi:hypothetical protein
MSSILPQAHVKRHFEIESKFLLSTLLNESDSRQLQSIAESLERAIRENHVPWILDCAEAAISYFQLQKAESKLREQMMGIYLENGLRESYSQLEADARLFQRFHESMLLSFGINADPRPIESVHNQAKQQLQRLEAQRSLQSIDIAIQTMSPKLQQTESLRSETSPKQDEWKDQEAKKTTQSTQTEIILRDTRTIGIQYLLPIEGKEEKEAKDGKEEKDGKQVKEAGAAFQKEAGAAFQKEAGAAFQKELTQRPQNAAAAAAACIDLNTEDVNNYIRVLPPIIRKEELNDQEIHRIDVNAYMHIIPPKKRM